MKSSPASVAQPEAILEWLHKEMGYRPLGSYASSKVASLPSTDSLRKICRGNMIPVWNFMLTRVKSEKTVEKIRRNILVHGGVDTSDGSMGGLVGHVGSRVRKSEKDNTRLGVTAGGPGSVDSRETALHERELAEKEVEKLRSIVKRQRMELRARMLEVSREEAERKRMLGERSNYRHKQVMLQAYEKQCGEASKIFAEYHKRLDYYVKLAKSAQIAKIDFSAKANGSHTSSENVSVYFTEKHTTSSEDAMLIESALDRNIRVSCETLAEIIIEKVRCLFPAYEGTGVHLNPQSDLETLSIDFVGEVPTEVRDMILDSLKHPFQLLKAVITYTSRLEVLLSKEVGAVNIGADSETMRYKDENKSVMDHLSLSQSSQFYENHGLEKEEINVPFSSAHNQLLERQLDVLAKERKAAGLRGSLSVLTFEVERLSRLCDERKEAESSLKKKWKKIEEFDTRRSELEGIYTALLKANMDATSFWSRQPSAAREYASTTILPACISVIELSNNAKDLIEREISAFYRAPDNSLYMLPSPSQAVDSMGASGASPEAVTSAEKNASLLTARAGSGDPSAIPSISRILAALQYPSDTGLASILESLRFCLKCSGSEACVLPELAKAMDTVRTRKDLVESSRSLLNHASRAHQEYDRSTNYCLSLWAEQEKAVLEKWLPELRGAVLNARKGLDDCKYVKGLLEEWWEQPASMVVDWVAVDGENVCVWTNHVKQLLAFSDKELL